MPDAAKNREVLAMFGQMFQVRRQRVAGARRIRSREKLVRQQSQVIADAEKTARHRTRGAERWLCVAVAVAGIAFAAAFAWQALRSTNDDRGAID